MIKNICIIIFALIGPVTLPAGGIQRDLNTYKTLNNSKEIILNANCSLYTFPKIHAKKCMQKKGGDQKTYASVRGSAEHLGPVEA